MSNCEGSLPTPLGEYSVEQLESNQDVFESLRIYYHKHGDHSGQRACEFALEMIRRYQMSTPRSEIGRSEPTTVPFCDIAGFKFHEGETYRFRKMYNCAACAKAEMEMFNVQR